MRNVFLWVCVGLTVAGCEPSLQERKEEACRRIVEVQCPVLLACGAFPPEEVDCDVLVEISASSDSACVGLVSNDVTDEDVDDCVAYEKALGCEVVCGYEARASQPCEGVASGTGSLAPPLPYPCDDGV